MLRKLALMLALIGTISSPVFAAGPPGLLSGLYSELIVFGDSLSDNGNLFALTGGALLPPPYAGGRASNGPVWVEYLAEDLDVPMTNMAFVGALTGPGLNDPPPSIIALGVDPEDLQIPAVGEQIDIYLADNQPTADSLVVIWAGANDIFFGDASIEQSVQNISDHITQLADNGAAQFLIPNLPPLEKTPYGVFFASEEEKAALELASLYFNALLAEELNALEAELGVSIIQFDVHTLLNDVIAKPYPYGFLDAQTPYLFLLLNPPQPGPLPQPRFFLFWDDVHPTTAGHEVLAEEALFSVIENALVP